MAAAEKSLRLTLAQHAPQDGATLENSEQLPTGRCNYTNLDVGGGKCGCLRFWDKARSSSSRHVAEAGFCFCSHHAVYHELGYSASDRVITGESLLRAKDQAIGLGLPGIPRVDQPVQEEEPGFQTNTTLPFSQPGDLSPSIQALMKGLQASGRSTGFPPLPSECVMPPDMSSGGIAGDPQAFLDMMDARNSQNATMDSPDHFWKAVGEPTQVSNRGVSPRALKAGPARDLEHHIHHLQSEVNRLNHLPRTPVKLNSTRDLTVVNAPGLEPNRQAVVNSPAERIMPHLETILKHVTAFPTLTTTSENHARRIDMLENASYSNIAIDELRDTTDNLAEQIRDVEDKVDDLKKTVTTLNDNTSVTSFRNSRFVDDHSSTSETSSAHGHADISARLEAIESQLLPSYINPWELEVIFLPYGSQLQGLWHTLDNFPSQRSRTNSLAVDDWTQAQNTTLADRQAKLDRRRSVHETWEELAGGTDVSKQWLVPRACAPGGKVEERLRSRGLIRKISVHGPDARDVQASMVEAFGESLKTINALAPHDEVYQTAMNGFHGLRSSWIPLRKVHKDSRLRLLDPSEMITPALWTVIFLLSSVAMRATGTRRLYVTHREAYLQDKFSSKDWTWQKLRELPRVHHDPESSAEVREADALERCWSFDGRLDPLPASVNTPFSSHHSSLSIRAAHPAGNDSSSSGESQASEFQSTTPTSLHHVHIPGPLKERPSHGRTTSMPLMPLQDTIIPQVATFTVSKRRIATPDRELDLPAPRSQHPQSSPVRTQGVASYRRSSPGRLVHSSQTRLSPNLLKRRRTSQSPSRPHDMITPRWSTGPSSPFIYEDVVDRPATTPLPYATPHSNFTPYNDKQTYDDDDDDKGSTTDEIGFDDDMDLYAFAEDDEGNILEKDDDRSNETSPASQNWAHDAQPHQHNGEDEVWEGVEDGVNNIFDDAMKTLSDDEEDNASDASSAPSEYPSTQPGLFYEASGMKAAFKIHVDEEEDENVAT